MKPWYCLSVQSHVSYFANIMCQLCLFCKLHPLHHPVHSCPCPPNSLSSVFLLCSILSPCLPQISGECSIFVLSLVVIWLSCYYTLMNLVIAFLAYCWCNYCIVCMYELHGTVVSVHAVYSTVRTMLGVSLPYRVHVHAAWYGSFSTPGVATVLFVPCLVSHYRIVCMYALHATVLSGTKLEPQFDVAQLTSIAVSHLFVLQTPH